MFSLVATVINAFIYVKMVTGKSVNRPKLRPLINITTTEIMRKFPAMYIIVLGYGIYIQQDFLGLLRFF